MKIKNIIILSLFVVLSSCNKGAKSKNVIGCLNFEDSNCKTKIVFPDITNTENLSTLIKDFKYIPLETTKDNIIGIPQSVKIYKNRIYVLDGIKSKALFVFTLGGEFLFQIGRQGNGPSEYNIPYSFEIEEDKIYINDANKLKVLIYSLNGDYISDYNVGFRFRSFKNRTNQQGDQIYAISGFLSSKKDLPFNLIHTDKTLEIKEKHFPINGLLRNYSINQQNALSFFNQSYYYKPPFDNIIYNYDSMSHKWLPEIYIDFGKHWPSMEYFVENNNKPAAFKRLRQSYMFNVEYFQTQKHIYFTYEYSSGSKNLGHALYNRETKKTKTIYNDIDDIYCGYELDYISGKKGDTLISSINNIRILEIIREIDKKGMNDLTDSLKTNVKELRKLSEGMSLTDNPILFLYTLKEKDEF